MAEIWKDIKGYEGLYKVSNTGKVLSCKTNKLLSLNSECSSGYIQVALYKDKKAKRFLVHRLVATAFIPNPNPEYYNVVDHHDGNKHNNNADNLEWTTQAENIYRALISHGKKEW